jgi:hypothetical protein
MGLRFSAKGVRLAPSRKKPGFDIGALDHCSLADLKRFALDLT